MNHIVTRLCRKNDALAAELVAEQESNTYLNNLHKSDEARKALLEAALLAIAVGAETHWREGEAPYEFAILARAALKDDPS